MKSLVQFYKNMSTCGKILLYVSLLLILVVLFNSANKKMKERGMKEGFEHHDTFAFKQGVGVYDEFYSEIYDMLMFNQVKNEYEIGQIVNSTSPTSESIILDIGCGTGNHVANLNDQHINVTGLDISPDMIKQAKEKFPSLKFKVGDAMSSDTFAPNSFTHILCLYFTIYYFPDKEKFFSNCMEWLMPGGHLVIHLVNKDKFDPILPPGNPLYIVSPQKYAKKRITQTKVKFHEFDYTSDFDLDNESGIARFNEKFQFENGKVRKQEHKLYMEPEKDIITRARDLGFIIQGQVDLLNCGYEYQYLYILMKP